MRIHYYHVIFAHLKYTPMLLHQKKFFPFLSRLGQGTGCPIRHWDFCQPWWGVEPACVCACARTLTTGPPRRLALCTKELANYCHNLAILKEGNGFVSKWTMTDEKILSQALIIVRWVSLRCKTNWLNPATIVWVHDFLCLTSYGVTFRFSLPSAKCWL